MVHALRRIHRSLRSEGVLLDLHPQPEPAVVEVWQGSRVDRIGHLDQEEDIRDILEARARLDQVEVEGWYSNERRNSFDLLAHFPSAQAWLDYRAKEGDSSVVSAELLASANRFLATGGGELVIREPIRASVLTRLPGPGSGSPES
ncbi:MAG TPA: hypothetical protein VNT92_09560 [Acidimicrobiia bacterium]|nr:hypothetical protein [Acidimicrobiia bacterium]